jgi:hypothetical protein
MKNAALQTISVALAWRWMDVLILVASERTDYLAYPIELDRLRDPLRAMIAIKDRQRVVPHQDRIQFEVQLGFASGPRRQ